MSLTHYTATNPRVLSTTGTIAVEAAVSAAAADEAMVAVVEEVAVVEAGEARVGMSGSAKVKSPKGGYNNGGIKHR